MSSLENDVTSPWHDNNYGTWYASTSRSGVIQPKVQTVWYKAEINMDTVAYTSAAISPWTTKKTDPEKPINW